MRKKKMWLKKGAKVEIGQHFPMRKNHIEYGIGAKMGMDCGVELRPPKTPEALQPISRKA